MPPTTSELIFSEQAGHNFSKTLGELKRSTLSIQNRLGSIQHDAAFARQVLEAYGRPLIANERCGSWYIDPSTKGGSAYFKSTDGHTGVWKFSLRRLNLQLLEIVGKNDGCTIIDSTRRGKRMPDALSKTVPIWCAVLNRYLFPNTPHFHELYTPPQTVSEIERVQISALLPAFTTALHALHLPSGLSQSIRKPLRPVWVTPESQLEATTTIFEDFHPIICCTVSRRVVGGEVSEGGYIQGAGDDTENWAHGLTPSIFWKNTERLLSTPESDLPEVIEILVQKDAESSSTVQEIQCVKPTSSVFITSLPIIRNTKDTKADICTIALHPIATKQVNWKTSPTTLDVGLGPEKLGSKNLRSALPFIMDFVQQILYPVEGAKNDKEQHMILACHTGTDLSIGVALAILCLYFDSDGEVLKEPKTKSSIDKAFIRARLGWFSTSMPGANPSRATLQSGNIMYALTPDKLTRGIVQSPCFIYSSVFSDLDLQNWKAWRDQDWT